MHPVTPPSLSMLSRLTPGLVRRRAVAAALAATPVLWQGLHAQPAPNRRATPAQTEGPFYPLVLPEDTDYDLLRNGALNYPDGQSTWLEGSVSDLSGQPVVGAQVEIWQCDQAGHYKHPRDGGKADNRFQGFGRVTVGADGRYRFRTIRPAPYTGRTPHIHVKVKLGRRELLTTQLYVEGESRNMRDALWRSLSTADRAALTVPFEPTPDGLRASFAIAVAI